MASAAGILEGGSGEPGDRQVTCGNAISAEASPGQFRFWVDYRKLPEVALEICCKIFAKSVLEPRTERSFHTDFTSEPPQFT